MRVGLRLTAMLLAATPAVAAELEYGRFLAGECAACHQAENALDGIPRTDFTTAMEAFRYSGDPVMQDIVRSLDARDIAALADHYAASKP